MKETVNNATEENTIKPKTKFFTKDKVCVFIIGLLLGAVIASAAFLIYTNVNNSNQSHGMPSGGTPPEMSEDGTPPELPDGETPPEMPSNETSEDKKPSNTDKNSSSESSSPRSSNDSNNSSNSNKSNNSGNTSPNHAHAKKPNNKPIKNTNTNSTN